MVDTAACIGCGLCVVACKEENDVPEEPAYTRTWVERHTTTTDGDRSTWTRPRRHHGFPAESTAPGAAGKAVASSLLRAAPVHAVRRLPVHLGLPGRGDVPAPRTA